MSSNGYKLLGFAVWHGGRWYLRRRFSPRRLVKFGVLGVGALGASAVLAKRLAG